MNKNFLAIILVTLGTLAVIAIAILMRYWISGGLWECVPAQDPALCGAVYRR